MRKTILFVVIFFISASLFVTSAYSQSKLVIVSPGPGHPMYMISKKTLPEAYKKIGYDLEFKDLPARRANMMIDSGKVDGYLFAGSPWALSHPNTILVNSPLGYDEIVVFTKKVFFKPKSWESLKPYKIGYMLGMTVVIKNTKGMNVDSAENPDQAFKKLMADRTDIVVFPKFLEALTKKKYPQIKYLMLPVDKVSYHTFLHKKHADIVPEINAVLSEMQSSGRINEIAKQVMSGKK